MNERLDDVYAAASFLFITQGYKKTQVADIAKRAKMATGSIYHLFSGKTAILHFVLLATLDKSFLDKEIALPMQEDPSQVLKRLTDVCSKMFAALDSWETMSFSQMLSISFDYASDYQVAFNIINDNPSILGEIEREYRVYINRLYLTIEKSLLHHMNNGVVRPIEYPSLHIRNIIEGIIWWAMYLPYHESSVQIPVETAKRISLDILLRAYLQRPQDRVLE